MANFRSISSSNLRINIFLNFFRNSVGQWSHYQHMIVISMSIIKTPCSDGAFRWNSSNCKRKFIFSGLILRTALCQSDNFWQIITNCFAMTCLALLVSTMSSRHWNSEKGLTRPDPNLQSALHLGSRPTIWSLIYIWIFLLIFSIQISEK